MPTPLPDVRAADGVLLLHQLADQTAEATRRLESMMAEYTARPEVHPGRAYLAAWFPNAIDQFRRQRERLARGVADPEYRAGGEFANVLGFYQGLGYAFDVDLSWSAGEGALLDQIHDLHPLALRILRLLDGSGAVAA